MTEFRSTDHGKFALTNAELEVMDNLLKAHDRGAFYMVYNAMYESNEAALQARIATFSGPVGGVAFGANRLLQEFFGPGSEADPEYSGIYHLSQLVAESALNFIRADLSQTLSDGLQPFEDGVADGFVNDKNFFSSADEAWGNLQHLFPGNLLTPTDVISQFVDDYVAARDGGASVADAFQQAFLSSGTPGVLASVAAIVAYDTFGKSEADMLAAAKMVHQG